MSENFRTIINAIETEFPDLGWLVRAVKDEELAVRAEYNVSTTLRGPYFAHVHSEQHDPVFGMPLISFIAEAETPEAALMGCLTQARENKAQVTG